MFALMVVDLGVFARIILYQIPVRLLRVEGIAQAFLVSAAS